MIDEETFDKKNLVCGCPFRRRCKNLGDNWFGCENCGNVYKIVDDKITEKFVESPPYLMDAFNAWAISNDMRLFNARLDKTSRKRWKRKLIH